MTKFIEIPASSKSLNSRSLIFGVGINDAEYLTSPRINGKRVVCKYYSTWLNMLERSYSNEYLSRNKTYEDVSVCEEWLTFSNFRKWMETQDYKEKELDKDILIDGNKTYSKDACIFISGHINRLLISNSNPTNGEFIGAVFDISKGKYISRCRVNGKRVFLGTFKAKEKASKAYLEFKSRYVESIANEEEASENPRLQQALLRHAKEFKEKAEKL